MQPEERKLARRASPIRSFWLRLQKRIGYLSLEGIGYIVAICWIALVDHVLKWLLGDDKRFFGVLPVVWAIDAGHLAVLIGLIINVVKKFGKDE